MSVCKGLSHLNYLLHSQSRFAASFVQHRTFSGPFRGTVEGINSAWKPKGAMLEHQNYLPCQPVPPLDQTVNRFLDSVRPLLDDDKYAYAVKLTQDFSKPGGDGEKLHKLLEKRADEKENWLADWWIKLVYLGWRSLPLFNNAAFSAPPMEQFKGKEGQLRCAAMAIRSVMDYKEKVNSQDLPIETIANIPQCMMQYFHALGCCRVPGPDMDVIKCYHDDPTASKHVTVLSNNHIFHVDVYDDRGQPLNIEQIQAQLETVLAQSQSKAPPIGILTDGDRDPWYEIYSELQKDPVNAASFDSINRSLFALSLNKPIPGYSRDNHFNVTSLATLTGGGTAVNSGNRWTDKSYQYFIHEDGVFTYSFDHAVAEGPPVLNIITNTILYMNKPVPDLPTAQGDIATPKQLQFNLTPKAESGILAVGDIMNSKSKEVTPCIFQFDKYGYDQVKKFSVPPDGFVQANIQLAHYRMYGHLVPTYESCSLRKFRLGRTETIRSASTPVLKWCQAMTRSDVSAQEKLELLREAGKHHQWYTRQCVQGQGIDRHLLGLKLTALECNMDVPAFLKDPIYTDSVQWTLSTTTVPTSTGAGGIFVPVVHDGYGIYYNPGKDSIMFCLSTWNTSQTTNIDQFKQSLEGALIDTYNMCLEAS